jgi:L-threonylcarbamoyladenylate synthase
MTDDIDAAEDAIRHGQLVIYPTETVYGLGANALDADAVERVYEAKNRNRSQPISMAVPDLETATEYTELTDRERAFIDRFLPGPVTVVVERTAMVPDVLTAGQNRVGIRIPNHDLALSLLDSVPPVTATSANASGNPSARTVEEVDQRVREYATTVLDGGETPGGGSTVVDVTHDEIHRCGALAEDVQLWLDEH